MDRASKERQEDQDRTARIERIVESVINETLFDTLADEMDLESGDISPADQLEINAIVERLEKIAVRYVGANA